MSVERDLPERYEQSERFELTSETPFNVNYLELKKIERSIGTGWGATPLNAYEQGNMELHANQANVVRELQDRAASPPDWQEVPENLRQFVLNSFSARHVSRTMANFDNYNARDHGYCPTPTEETLIRTGINGVASPAELAYIRHILDMPSIELGCLTHSYGIEIEHLDDMRRAVNDTIAILGGEFATGDEARPVYKIRHNDGIMRSRSNEPVDRSWATADFDDGRTIMQLHNERQRNDMHHVHDGVLMTRKRNIGTLVDGTVIRERTSFILRIDAASGLDQEVAERMRAVVFDGSEEAKAELMKAGGLDTLVPQLLSQNDFKRTIPLSTTIYAFNKKLRRHAEAYKSEDTAEGNALTRARSLGKTAIK